MRQQGGVERKKRTDLGEKYGGTGVFLPRLTDIVAGAGAGGGRRGGDGAKKTEETSRGTGVFLNHQVSVTFQKKDNSKCYFACLVIMSCNFSFQYLSIYSYFCCFAVVTFSVELVSCFVIFLGFDINICLSHAYLMH